MLLAKIGARRSRSLRRFLTIPSLLINRSAFSIYLGLRPERPFGWQRRRSGGLLFAGPPSTAEREIRARAETRIRFVHDCQIELSGFQIRRLWFRQRHRSVDAR